jgi:outer membrane autotransporter protein
VTNNHAGFQGGAIFTDGNSNGDVTLNAIDGNIIFSRNTQNSLRIPRANAIYFNNFSGTSQLLLNAAAGNAIAFFDPIESNGSNGTLRVLKTGAGAAIFDGSLYSDPNDRWSRVYGDTTVQAGTFFVRNNAVYGSMRLESAGFGPAGSSFTVDQGAILAGGILGEVRADNFALNGILDIAGAATPGSVGGGFSTFVVTSNNAHLGSTGVVRFNTDLNDASVQLTDLLVLNLNGSATTGTSAIAVTNVGGAGAITVGDGIKVVQTNDGTTANAFRLARPVTAGPYEYGLYRGGVNAPNENWYLRSTLNCTLSPNAAVCGSVPSVPGSGGNVPPPSIPHYSIETSLNAALPSMALLYGRGLLDTLHERVGEETDLAPPGRTSADRPRLGWARLIGVLGKQGGDALGVYGSGPQYDYRFFAVQAGFDVFRHERSDGSRNLFGLMFSVGGAQGDVTHFDGTTGTSKFDAFSVGGYWTHFGASGWYLDSILQGTFYDFRSTARRGFEMFTTTGRGITASVEAGKPYRFDNGYFIEPQAQLIYQWIGMDPGLQTTTNSTARVTFSNVESLVGRIGARFGRTWVRDDGTPRRRELTAWIRPNIWHEFLGNPVTRFSSADGPVPFHSGLGGTWGEINLGVSGQVDQNATLFANFSYHQSFDGSGHALSGKVGIRVVW